MEKKAYNKKNKNLENAFTLIELLAVIIILGVIMLIAIPSITSNITKSRKNSYIITAKEIIGGARAKVNQGDLEMFDMNTTYYIPSRLIETENSGRSPYGEFTEAYVAVIYTGKSYNYYWISTDETNTGVKLITPDNKLDTKDIESNVSDITVKDTVETTGIGNRTVIKILQADGTWRTINLGGTSNNYSEAGVPPKSAITYPDGKTKSTVDKGQIVKIGDEEFYVLNRYGSDLLLLAQYNLNVGSNAKGTATGRQDPDVKGWLQNGTKYGNVSFSSKAYWSSGIGTTYVGSLCTSTSGTDCAYVYDSHTNLYTYVNQYKTYLQSLDGSVKDARIISIEEANAFKKVNQAAWKETSYWTGSPYNTNRVWAVRTDGNFYYGFNYDSLFGIRPVVII